jgi:phospholipid transport system transporter-binding protein
VTAGVEFELVKPGHFSVKGRLQFDTVGHALAASESLFEKHKDIEIDLSGVEATDSAGLALLVELAGWAHREHRKLAYRHVPEQVMALARISEVDKLLPRA